MSIALEDWLEIDDHALVVMAQNGEANAFSQLVLRHHDYCLRLAVSILHERGDAEDEVQNAFLSAYKHIDQFRLDSQFTTWLSRIVLNHCRMNLRKTRRAREICIDEPGYYEYSKPIVLEAKEQSPYHELCTKQITNAVLHEATQMPNLLREVFHLSHVEELPISKVAEELGISVTATKSRLLRARMVLRSRLDRWGSRRYDLRSSLKRVNA